MNFDLIAQILFLCFFSLVLASLETQIEGGFGWAAKLPTWKHVGWLQKKFGSKKHLTGYHFYLNILIIPTNAFGLLSGSLNRQRYCSKWDSVPGFVWSNFSA